MAGPNDPFGAVSPFSDVLPPEEQYYRDMVEQAAPVELAPADLLDVDPSAGAMDPSTFPNLESFTAAMEPDPEMVFAEDEGMQIGDLGMYQPEGMQFAEEGLPVDEGMLPGGPVDAQGDFYLPELTTGVDGFETDTGFAPPIYRPETGVTAEGELGQYLEPGLDRVGDALMDPEGLEPGTAPSPEDMTTRALQIQEFEAAQAEQTKRRELQAAADSEDAAWQAENLKIREDANETSRKRIEAIYSGSKAISEQGIDNNRWWNSRSTGQKIASYAAALIGGQQGLMSGRGGNDAMDLIMGEIDKDIASQKYDIQSQRAGLREQRGLVSELYQLSGDMFQAEETARLAARQGISAQIDNELASIDPESTQARHLEMQKRRLDSDTQASFAQMAQANRKIANDDADREIDNREQEAKIKKLAAETAKIDAEAAKRLRRGTGKGKMKVGSVTEQEHLVKTGYMPQKDRHGLRIPAPGAENAVLRAQQPTDAKERKAEADAVLAERNASEQERDETLGVGGIMSKGKVARFVSESERALVSNKKAYVDEVTRLYDNIRIAREKHGFQSSFIDSDEYRAVRADHAKLVERIKSPEGADLGVIAGPDEKLIFDMIATGDVGEYRDFKKAMEHSRSLWVDSFNDYASAKARVGYKPDVYKPKRKDVAKTPEKKSHIETVDIVTAPTAPDVVGNRKQDVANRLPTLKAFMKERPGAIGARDMGQKIKAQVEAGDIPKAVAWDLVDQGGLAPVFAKTVRFDLAQRYKESPTPELKLLLDDAEHIANDLGTHKENYEFLTGEHE